MWLKGHGRGWGGQHAWWRNGWNWLQGREHHRRAIQKGLIVRKRKKIICTSRFFALSVVVLFFGPMPFEFWDICTARKLLSFLPFPIWNAAGVIFCYALWFTVVKLNNFKRSCSKNFLIDYNHKMPFLLKSFCSFIYLFSVRQLKIWEETGREQRLLKGVDHFPTCITHFLFCWKMMNFVHSMSTRYPYTT